MTATERDERATSSAGTPATGATALGARRDRLRLGGAGRVAFVIAAVLIGVPLLLHGVDQATTGTPPSSGAPASSYSFDGSGLGAFAELLGHNHVPVRRLRGDLAHRELDPSHALFVIEAESLTRDELDTLGVFVLEGGHLVIGGRDPTYLDLLRDDVPQWQPGSPTVLRAEPALAPISEIRTNGEGSFDGTTLGPTTTPLVDAGGRVVVATRAVGSGTIVYLADGSFLSNERLADADNAALGLALAGDRPVDFGEGVHGYDDAQGFGALPDRWKLALGLLGCAALVFMWSRGRRLGVPDRPDRTFAPARIEHIDALGALLARTRDPDVALHEMRAAARGAVIRRAHLDADVSPDAIRAAAARCELRHDEIAAITAPDGAAVDVLAVGRAFARVKSWERP